MRCLDERAQPCDSFSFQTTPEGLATLEEHVFQDGANPIIAPELVGLPWLMVAVYLRSCHPDCRLVKAKTQKMAACKSHIFKYFGGQESFVLEASIVALLAGVSISLSETNPLVTILTPDSIVQVYLLSHRPYKPL